MDILERWYTAHADAVFAFALNLTRDVANAQDVLQEVFRRLAARDAWPEDVRSECAFLLTLTHRAVLDEARLGQPAAQTVRWPWSSWWRDLIWPNPKAWGGVAIVWMAIAVAEFSLPATVSSKQTGLAQSEGSHSVDRESFQRMREQREMLARLLTPPAPAPAVRGPERIPQILFWKTKWQEDRENIV